MILKFLMPLVMVCSCQEFLDLEQFSGQNQTQGEKEKKNPPHTIR